MVINVTLSMTGAQRRLNRVIDRCRTGNAVLACELTPIPFWL